MRVHRGVGIKQHLIARAIAPNVGRDIQHDHGIFARLWRRYRTRASRVIPADSSAVNCYAVESASVVLAAFILPHAFCPVAHSSAVNGSHLTDVVLAFNEALSLKLAERIYGVGVEDRLMVDALAHYLEALEMTVVALGSNAQLNIVNPNLIHVIIDIMEGDIHALTSVIAEVDAVETPVLITVGFVAHIGLGV